MIIKIVIIVVLIFAILVTMSVVAYFYLNKTTTLYFKESASYTLNPGKGFFYPVKSYNYHKVKEAASENMSLIFILFDIEEYKDREISADKLKELELCFVEAKKYGLKAILRVAYGFERSSREPESLELIHSHVLQLKPIMDKYGDLLYVVEAGLLGPWGEWHSSTHGNPPELNARLSIIEFWQEVLPSDTFINVRRPSFVRDMYPESELTKDNAYLNYGISRIGWHNDALLSNDDDMGTYPEELTRQDELSWSKSHNLYAPFGGETCCESDYAAAQNAILEFEQLRISYLNIAFNEQVIQGWKNEEYNGENAFDYINKHIGYRFVLDRTSLKEKTAPERMMKVKLWIYNSGFSSMYYSYYTSLVVTGPEGYQHKYPLDTDVRYWTPDIAEILVEGKISLPADAVQGQTYKIGIEFSDMKDFLSKNILYNIALSNDDIEYKLGINYFAEYVYEDGNFIIAQKDIEE